eukprot:COSAG01_NODE_9515_length_2422_cov_2.959105_1_plen_58_part_00
MDIVRYVLLPLCTLLLLCLIGWSCPYHRWRRAGFAFTPTQQSVTIRYSTHTVRSPHT